MYIESLFVNNQYRLKDPELLFRNSMSRFSKVLSRVMRKFALSIKASMRRSRRAKSPTEVTSSIERRNLIYIRGKASSRTPDPVSPCRYL